MKNETVKQPEPILVAGQWREANAVGAFRAKNPADGQAVGEEYPISTWADCDALLSAAAQAGQVLRETPGEKIAQFLKRYAERIEAHTAELVDIAHQETGLPKSPRLAHGELPRTTDQLRQAAGAAAAGSWSQPTIDVKQNIRSRLEPLGTILVIGPNNFPFAFNGISGGDFAAAIASGNAVIAKSHPSHPGTTRLLAREAAGALSDSGLPPAAVQLVYHMANDVGLKMVADPRLGATAFTGSRRGGLALKAAADAAGKPIYLEMSSINPLVLLPGALAERGDKIAEEFVASALMGTGQFCTNPGLTLLVQGEASEKFIAAVQAKFESAPPGLLFSAGVRDSLAASVQTLEKAGARRLTGGSAAAGEAVRFANTLLRAGGDQFLAQPHQLQCEAFGNASLIVVARDVNQIAAILDQLEGNLTGSIYSATQGGDDAAYSQLAPRLTRRVGRLLNDKMPTGVAVSPAMNHGGPFPATGHPGFTAVGIPASLRRFAMLECYDNVRQHRLPPILQDKNPEGKAWRMVDGNWTQGDVGSVK